MAKSDNFDDEQIWKSEKPAQNLLDDNNILPQEKQLGWKVENSEILRYLQKYQNFQT